MSYIPLAQRNVWADVVPISQNDGPNPLVAIMYAEEYRDAMDYFRAVSKLGEKTERVLELTETIIRQNPAHYTVWGYRLDTLLALGKDLEEELELMNEFARANLKSYQVWHHRLLLLTHLDPRDPHKEIDYIHDSLLPDPKNYHTWAYLHWLYSHFSDRITDAQWQSEEMWCDEMLRTDGRNNSAWGWRWFLKVGRPGATGQGEVDYTIRAINLLPHNVSAWNYLRGLLKHLNMPLSPYLDSVRPYTTSEGSSEDTPLPVSHAIEYTADAMIEQGRLDEARQLFIDLGTKHDRIRASYWDWRQSSFYVLFWEWDVTSTNPESVACFSQWLGRSFIDPDHEGTIYKTAEHYMMAAKARMFDPEAEAAIIASSTPEEAKQMGRAVRNFDRAKWNETADDVVQRASYLRFTQHADLHAYLLATGDKTMVEASPSDRIWEIGFSVRDAPGREGEWGQNRMGLALTRAKIQIKEEEARRY